VFVATEAAAEDVGMGVLTKSPFSLDAHVHAG
jgi:hypothetical protein